MTDILRPVLELSVIIPGILLAYLPVKSYLRQTPLKLTAWLLPLLLGICIFGGAVCCALPLSHQMGPVSSAACYYAYLS
jgi:hypothetical protein